MSVRDLRGAVHREKEKHKLGVGRKPALPVGIPAGVREISTKISELSQYFRIQGHDLIRELKNCPPDEITESLVVDLGRLQELLANLIP